MKRLCLLFALVIAGCGVSDDKDLPQGFDYREYVDHESSTCKVVMHSENVDPYLSLLINGDYITVGAFGGFSSRYYYKEYPLNIQPRLPSREHPLKEEKRYVLLEKNSSKDPGRFVWAVHNSFNGRPRLDSATFIKYMAVGEGPDGLSRPSEQSLFLVTESVVAPLSVFDAVGLELKRTRSKIDQKFDEEKRMESINLRIDVFLILDPTLSDDQLLRDVVKYRPLLASTKELFPDVRIHLRDTIASRFRSEEKLVKFMYQLYGALGLELQKERERSKDYCVSREQIENLYSFDSISRGF